jgi:two-component system NtrC family sensor kinase
MKNLPRAAQYYLGVLWAAAAILVGTTLFHDWEQLYAHAVLLLLILPIYVLADYFEVHIEVNDGNLVAITVVEAPSIFLLATVGSAGLAVVVLGTCIVDMLGKRPWYKCLFNVAQRSLTYLLMLLFYSLISIPGAGPFSGFRGLLAFIAIAATYYLFNTLLVSTVLALATRQSLLKIYADSYRQVRWVHFINLPSAAILAVLWQVNPWLVLPGFVPVIMAQRSFKAVAAWQSESRRSRELAREARQLAGKLERLQDTTTAMMASLEPMPLLETVSTRLATLLEASASWVVLLDAPPRLVAARGLPESASWDAAAYAGELRHGGVRQLDAGDIARLCGVGESPWQTLLMIPLALESRLMGGICLAIERPLALAEDDQRVLLAFAAQAALAMEHARLFEELRHKQDELVRSSKLAALGTFSAGIAHEFNNLLAGILGFAELGRTSDNVAEKDEALNVAVQACLRGRSITSGLLTFARRSDPQRGAHQIRDAVEETLTLVERELAKVNIRVERRLHPVPPTICDLGQISQVLLNLMTNARDAMMEQGGVITIDLSQRDGMIELAVSDTGTGIAPELLDQMFQPFMTTKGALGGSKTPGTGLGLAISYGIVESHGGTITPRSELGRGTTMTVRLPITGPAVVAAMAAPAPLPPLRILVVDDERIVAEALMRLLESYGHRVSLALDGELGLELYREQPFDLVITDVIMPGMGGAEFSKRLQAIDSQAQVLVMTGQPVSSQVDQMLSAGAIGVVSKPFETEELLAIIERSMRVRMLAAA